MHDSLVESASQPFCPVRRCEFDSGVQSSLRSVAPRRRLPTSRSSPRIKIFEDEFSSENNASKGRHQASQYNSRGNPRVSSGNQIPSKTTKSSISRPTLTSSIETQESVQNRTTAFNKEPRRRTIWVPDDTTVLTIHPGNHNNYAANSNILPIAKPDDNDTAQLDIYHGQPRRTGRRKSLAQAPRRGAPLQPILKPLQENVEGTEDLQGVKTGKENIPPGMEHIEVEKPLSEKTKASQILLKRRNSVLHPLELAAMYRSDLTSKKRDSSSLKEHTVYQKPRRPSMAGPMLRVTPSSSRNAPHQNKQLNALTTNQHALSDFPNELHQKFSSDLAQPTLSSLPSVRYYPLILENIEQPQMFEDSWLSNQEIAISELINRIFSTNFFKHPMPDPELLRRRLLDVYQGKSMVVLYQRLQASLQFGALSLPKEKEGSTNCLRFVNDIGLRRQFMNLWVKNYNERLLRAAAEVVVGRRIPGDNSRPFLTSDLEAFISSCLLRNEDSILPIRIPPKCGSSTWNWRRTMQRGLMLIILLDKIKEYNLVPGNLFKKGSLHKSSVSVMAEFGSILIPWGGDISRSLSQLHYNLHYCQYALWEYDYTVKNLAVDLRDGIRLTRLVEILMYPDGVLHKTSEKPSVILPNGEVLDISGSNSALGPLSQHLKYPCNSDVSKSYNNQIALSALLSIRSTADIATKTTATDIVDGHRENTLALLWALVCHQGLNSLIDWEDVRSELLRISPGIVHETLLKKNLTLPSQRTQNRLLREWAIAIATKNSINLPNFTTALADGMVFERIVDEYRQYFVPGAVSGRLTSGLEAKLRSLGCSVSFASLFGHSVSHGLFFDEDFTNATLAFLCSRLLEPSRHIREQRKMLKQIAEDCATVVQTRERVLSAAVVLQRAWRAHFAMRLSRFEKGEVDIWLV